MDEGDRPVPVEGDIDCNAQLVDSISSSKKLAKRSSSGDPMQHQDFTRYIGPKLLQKLKAEVSPLLAIIFKKSLESGTILEDWQVANNTPIFKKGSKSTITLVQSP